MTPGSGRYRYALDGCEQAIDECHDWQRRDKGWRFTGRRHVDGSAVFEVEAGYTVVDGALQCHHLMLRWQAGTPRVARYRLDAGTLHWHIDEAQTQRTHAGTDSLLFPLLRSATGPLLDILAGGGTRTVIVPRLHDATAPDFLGPLISQRRVDTLPSTHAGQRRLRYFGGEYGDTGCDCWLDAQNRLLRYTWASPQGLWDVRLDGS